MLFRCGCNPRNGEVCSWHCQWQGCTETRHTAECIRGERVLDDDDLMAVLEEVARPDDEITLPLAPVIRAGLVEHGDGRWQLTTAGKSRLAELWGPDRVPPDEGGYVDCWRHDVYDVGPGDLWGCPKCRTEAKEG